MIAVFNVWEALFNVLSAGVTFIMSLFPDWTPIDWTSISTAIHDLTPTGVSTFFRWVDYYVPLHEALGLVVVTFGLWLTYTIWRLAKMILQWLHVLGGN
jgi:hypothetical protein